MYTSFKYFSDNLNQHMISTKSIEELQRFTYIK